jgi:hypothetical protein
VGLELAATAKRARVSEVLVRRASTACLIAGVLSVAGWSTPAGAAVRCVVRGHAIRGVAHSRVVSVSDQVVVYRTRGPTSDGFWACGRKGNRFVLVGRDDTYQSAEEEYGPTTTLSQFHVAGNWLIVTHETGADEFAGCTKYAISSCSGPVDTLVVVNVARGLRGQLAKIITDQTNASGKVSQVTWTRTLLSPEGAAAWLQTGGPETGPSSPPPGEPRSSLYGCLLTITNGTVGCTGRLFAQGDIAVASLRLAATTLSWTAGAQPQSALLG